MSHDLEIVNGSASFVDARMIPWHGLGTVLDQDGMDIDQMLKLANLDFTPELHPIYADVNGRRVLVQGRQAVMADRFGKWEVLGDVGRRWAPVAPRTGAEFAQQVIDASDGYAGWQAAGMLRPMNKYDDTIGSQAFYSLKLDGTVTIGGVDPIDHYLLVTHGFDGSLAFTLKVTPVRVVCANTQRAALQGAGQTWKMNHGKRIEGRMQEAREAIELAIKYVTAFDATAEILLDQAYTDAEFKKLIAQVWPTPAKDASPRIRGNYVDLTEKLVWHFDQSPTVQAIKGTKWGAYQAVTEYLDWGQRINGDNVEVKRLTRTTMGEYDTQKLAAWDLLMKPSRGRKVVSLAK
jgi:phage/plasmid-like protein (TIGR03299 family)